MLPYEEFIRVVTGKFYMLEAVKRTVEAFPEIQIL